MNKASSDGPLIIGRLATLERIAGALAEDFRPFGGDLRRARGVLLALRAAIHNGSLDSLCAVVQPWMQAEVTRVDALTQGAAFDELSAVVGEMALPDEDWVEHWQQWNDGVEA